MLSTHGPFRVNAMKRYMELIQKLLEWAEQKQTVTPQMPPEIEGFTLEQVRYHVRLCGEAGYLDIQNQHLICCLTWAGHEALAQLRKG